MDSFKTSMSEPEPILYPNLNDVLSGRGNAANNHPGNVFFREQVKNYKTQYVVSSPASWMKLKIAETIVTIVASQDPPGRFLKQDSDNGAWYPLDEKDIIKKVRQALAEGASEILKKHGKTGKTSYSDDCDPQPSKEYAYTHLPTEALSRQALAEGASEIVKKLGDAVKSCSDYNPYSPMILSSTPLPIETVATTTASSSSEFSSENRETILQKRENAKKKILSLLGMDADCDTGPDGTILIPHDNDVLSGRGNAVNNHPGNVFFRDQVKYYKSEYILFTPASWMKCKIAETVVEIIRNQNPPGRFLKQADTGGVWYPLDEKDIIKKVRQALREGTSDILKPEKKELSSGNINKDTSQTKNHTKGTISDYDMEVRKAVKNCSSQPTNHSNMTTSTSTSTKSITDCKPSIHQGAESRGGGNSTEQGEFESTRDCIMSLLSLSQGYESTTKSNNKNNDVPGRTFMSTQLSSLSSFPSSSNQQGRNISSSRSREALDSEIVYKKAKLHS